LTALLVAHGIRHAVVCPGSRNAPIVHNLNECPDIACHGVTDERSAGFYALGMAQALDQPVAVCVTSGTALLNLAPAVAEACYQHRSLVVISADRPPQWIDQLDGQTLPQPDALGRFVAKAVSLPEPRDDEERWYCNRLVNEALLEAQADHHPCVHINVPITEPLFTFDVPQLPVERVVVRCRPTADYESLPPELVDGLLQAQRPMIVFGQSSPHLFSGDGTDFLFSHVIVLHESLSPFPSVSHFDEVLANNPSAVGHPAYAYALNLFHVGEVDIKV
jgi:2-succinyl-5-enolpyruvyl-6-hydroxy-3-cyclohexene-1-carboxylate synthase